MTSTLSIAKRQFASYINTPVAYIVVCTVLVIVGIFFWQPFFISKVASMRQFWTLMTLAMVVGAPALTMGVLADEKQSGTLEVLLTMPVRDHELILGKFLAVLGIWGVMLLLSLTYPISISSLGDIDLGQVAAGYIGMFLTGAAMLSFGVAASSWTSSQVVALFVSFLYCLMLAFGFPQFLQFFSQGIAADIIRALSFPTHLDQMARGIVDLRDLIYFATMIGFPLLLAFRSIESRRWR